MMALPAATLVDTCLKATLILAGSALVVRALRQGSAATRHLVWTLGVLAVLTLPAVRALAPRWEVPLLPAVVPGPAPESVALVAPAALDAPPARKGAALRTPVARTSPRTTPAAPGTTGLGIPLSPARLAALVWLAGAVAVTLPLLLGALRVARLGRRSEPLASSAWTALQQEIAAELALARPVRLLRGESGAMPMAWGVLRPAVLLPAEAEEWPEARRRAVLTHELAHVKRHDCLTQALAHFACALYWFHPLVWVAARRLRSERELACDDLVLRCGASGPDYADHLLQLARSFRASRHPVWATVAMARPSQLEGRLLAILDPALDRRGPSRLAAGFTLAMAAGLLIALAGFHPWARPALAAQAAAPEAPVVVAAHESEDPAAAPVIAQAVAEAVAETRVQVENATHEAVAEAFEEEAPASNLSAAHTERVVAALTGALRDADDEVRREAVGALGQIRAQSAAVPLAEALGDKDGEVRAQAAFALGQIRAETAVAPLVAALADTDAEVRQQAVFALGQIRAKTSVEGLIGALRDVNVEVRQQAAFALAQIRDPRSVAPLSTALGDREAEVRQQAVFALGQIRAPEAAGALAKALKDTDAEVRQQAAFALGQLRAVEAVPGLIAALGDESAEVRQQAAFALGQIRDERAADPLTAALKDKDADVRRQAAFALGQLAH